jgi:WD40 repeat protein
MGIILLLGQEVTYSLTHSLTYSLTHSLTQGAEIIEVGVKSGTMLGKPLLQGHGMRELWGLATHPTKDEFITSGDDATIRVWDSKTFHLIKTVRMDTASRAIAYSPNGKYVAVGFGFGKRSKGRAAAKEGAFAVLTASDMKIAHEGKVLTHSLTHSLTYLLTYSLTQGLVGTHPLCQVQSRQQLPGDWQ